MLIRQLAFAALPLLLTACTMISEPESSSTLENESLATLNKTEAQNEMSQAREGAEQDTASLLDETKQAQQEAQAKQIKVEQETERREALFQSNLKQPKSVGTTVCTWKNSFGYVAAVEEERMKINVQGRAPSATHGIFFSSDTSQLEIDPQEATVWTDGSDWAVCEYEH